MRTLGLIVGAIAVAAVLGRSAGAAEPNVGVLSVANGRGAVMLDLRGSVLGVLGGGSLRVTDLTPRDRFTPLVTGRKLTQERLGARTVVYRGAALRFRMVGGGYRITIRGWGIFVSAVGRGVVAFDGEPRVAGESVGVYSFEDVDCAIDPTFCIALPEEYERFTLGPPPPEGEGETRAPR
jgi:hypothetical protein